MGRVDLGYTADEFGRLTPAELASLLKRWRMKQDRDDFHFAQITAMIAEVHRDPNKRSQPYAPADFMPRIHKPKKDAWKGMLAMAEQLNAAFGGQDLRAKEPTQ